jgi:hypothetical protein
LAGSSSHFLNYISVNNSIRPVIVKLHHDYLLSPKNTEQDTNTLPPEFKKNLTPVLEGVHLIVIGYGGYDTGIAPLLSLMVLSHFSLNALAAGMPESTEAPAPKKKPYLVSLSLASATA